MKQSLSLKIWIFVCSGIWNSLHTLDLYKIFVGCKL